MFETLQLALSVFFFVLGLVIGSFLNVCIYRIPKRISVAAGRSMCPACGAAIRAYDNIPVISWLALRGKCRDCGERIPFRYPLVELLGGVSFLLVWLRFGPDWQTPIFCAFAAVLIALGFIDLDTQEIPDRFHFIILGLGIAAAFAVPEPTLVQRLIGAACVSLPMLLIAFLTGGFGLGDIKLMAVSGFLLGWQSTVFAALLGCIVAAVVAVALIAAKRKTRKDKIAFGPYLAIALFIAALYAPQIIRSYFGLFSIYI